MIRLVSIIALGFLAVSPGASAQDRGVLAIGLEAGRHAFSFSGEADAVNMCGTVDCEVVATFTACLGVAYSSPTQGQNVWTWVEAATEEDARVGAMNECTAAGGPACEVLNVFCLDGTAIEAALDLDSATRRLIQEWLQAGGFDPGGADGLFGPRTRRAIRQWQAAQGVPSTGYLTSPQIEALEGGDGSQLQASVTGTRVVDLETVTANVADAETNIESSDQGVAQDLGFLAIGPESATHAFSFSGADDAVNMCGMTDCEVFATFEACLGVAYSRPILERAANLRIVEQVPPVWRWAKAVEEGDARVAALQECQRAGGTACEVLNVYCVDVPDKAEAALVSEPDPERVEVRLRPGDVFRDCDVCPEMVVLPEGDLAMGRYEVTLGEYRAFAAATGGGGNDCGVFSSGSWRNPEIGGSQTDNHPVVCVSWNDAQEYVSWLGRTTGVTYRLPTDAEWGRLYSQVGDDHLVLQAREEGCIGRNLREGTCPVGSYDANEVGLYDMIGNVWEYLGDCSQAPYLSDEDRANCAWHALAGESYVALATSQYARFGERNASRPDERTPPTVFALRGRWVRHEKGAPGRRTRSVGASPC